MTTRDILELVQIDMDQCTLTYGTGACAAILGTTGAHKCFNSLKTCQSVDNYSKAAKTLTFGKNQDGLPKGQTVFPCLQSVSTNATMINIAGVDSTVGSLGKRERVTVNLLDFTYHDTLTDKYQSQRLSGAAQADGIGYNPADRGTFWGKFKARSPYYYGRPIRILRGYVGDDLSAMRTTHYMIDSISGPDVNGRVTIVARDILAMAENEKALCPKTSTGRLKTDITSSATSFSFSATGSGADYATSGVATIGSEIVRFTRSGDNVTLTQRGIYGSDAASHSEGDTFQQSYEVTETTLSQAIGDILREFAGVPSSYIDQAEWNTETNRWLAGLKVETLIAKPTGVLTLLAELAQLGVSIWWDGVAQKIRYRLNRLVDVSDPYTQISDAANILEGTITTSDRPDLRVSQVLLYHSPIDYSSSATSADNYNILQVAVDLEAEGADQYDQSQIRTFYSRWIAKGSESAARAIVSRALARYRAIPTDITFDLDIKDVDGVGVASVLEITSRVLPDAIGNATAKGAQVMQFEETAPGHRVTITAQTFAFDGRYGFVMVDGSGIYTAATDEEKRLGCWIAPDENGFADGLTPYQLY